MINSCDLLSFYYLCRTGNNAFGRLQPFAIVVICFHFTIFVVLETTWLPYYTTGLMLWFAFILLSLSYWKQPYPIKVRQKSSCDLLSFYYLCRTGNNVSVAGTFSILLWFAFILLSLSYWKQRYNPEPKVAQVVICFHFTIFVVLETTFVRYHVGKFRLWFAFILLSLSYWKQQVLFDKAVIARCDLLSFYYLCRTGNNLPWKIRRNARVVICFHFTIFVVLETTLVKMYWLSKWLWFAFILLSLSYWKQLPHNW